MTGGSFGEKRIGESTAARFYDAIIHDWTEIQDSSQLMWRWCESSFFLFFCSRKLQFHQISATQIYFFSCQNWALSMYVIKCLLLLQRWESGRTNIIYGVALLTPLMKNPCYVSFPSLYLLSAPITPKYQSGCVDSGNESATTPKYIFF